MRKTYKTLLLLVLSSHALANSRIDQCNNLKPIAECEQLVADLYNSPDSKAPQEDFLKNKYFTQWDSKNGTIVLIPNGNSILPVYLSNNCLNENKKKCLSEAIEENHNIYAGESFAGDLTQVGKLEREWGIRPDHTKDVTKYQYLMRQNGNYIIGYIEDCGYKCV